MNKRQQRAKAARDARPEYSKETSVSRVDRSKTPAETRNVKNQE